MIMTGTFVLLILIIIVFAIIFSVYKAFKRSEKRADEKLNLEKEQTLVLQKRVNEMNKRLIVIEKMLKEVE